MIRISPHDSSQAASPGWLADGDAMPAHAPEVLRALGSTEVVERVVLSITARNAPPLFGGGLIDALPDATLENAASEQPAQIRGRVHRMKNGHIGRFGWKAQVVRLEDFVLTCCANNLGLEVPGHHQGASPLNPDARARALDLTQGDCNALVSYVRSLPAPVVIAPSLGQGSRDVEDGRKAFESIGCTGCHSPDLGTIRGIYSDLLLHDMGEELGDAGKYFGTYYDEQPGSANSSKFTEWRTPPLWGFRDSGPYLHDGRALTLDEAVALHGGQGRLRVAGFKSCPGTTDPRCGRSWRRSARRRGRRFQGRARGRDGGARSAATVCRPGHPGRREPIKAPDGRGRG